VFWDHRIGMGEVVRRRNVNDGLRNCITNGGITMKTGPLA